MIKLLRDRHDQAGIEAEERLTEMGLAFEVCDRKGGEPVLEDEGKQYKGLADISRQLDELEKVRQQWYKFQSDACYIDEDGEVC